MANIDQEHLQTRQHNVYLHCPAVSCLLYAYLLDTTFSVCHFTWIYMYSSSILFTTRSDGLSLVSSYYSLVHHRILLSCMHDIFIILICFNQCETIASYIVRCFKIEKLWSNPSNFKCQCLYVRYGWSDCIMLLECSILYQYEVFLIHT